MAGMVGSAIGWQAVPYLDGARRRCPALARHLVRVAEAPADRRWFIAPGYCLRGTATARVDVMRGEETQLFGALHLLGPDASDGCYVLPGTHSKWVRLQRGRIIELRTYMTGELFALLRQHGTLASAMQTAGRRTRPAALRHDERRRRSRIPARRRRRRRRPGADARAVRRPRARRHGRARARAPRPPTSAAC